MHVWWHRVCQIHVHPKVNDFNRSNSCFFFHTLSCSFPLNAYCLTQSFEPLSIVVILKWNSSKLKMRATTEPFPSNELKNSTLFKLNRKISLFIFDSVVAREKGRLHAQPPHFECEWCECVAIRKNKQFSTWKRSIPTDLNGAYFVKFIFLIRFFFSHSSSSLKYFIAVIHCVDAHDRL